MTVKELKLVRVVWGDEQALLSLALKEWLCGVSGGDDLDYRKETPTIEIYDDEMIKEYGKEACWADVFDFLAKNAKRFGIE